MQDPDNAILSELGITEWLEAYQHISASAVGTRRLIGAGLTRIQQHIEKTRESSWNSPVRCV